MNEYSKELCHWGLELGAKKDNHKYVARVETKPGKYLYFYDLSKYQAWKNGTKGKVQDAANNIRSQVKSKIDKAATKVNAAGNELRTQAQSRMDRARTTVTNTANRAKAQVQSRVDLAKNAVAPVANTVKNTAEKVKSAVPEPVRDATAKVNKQTKEALKNGGVKLSVAVNKYKQYIEGVANDAKDKAGEQISSAKENAERSLNEAKTNVGNKVNDLRSKAESSFDDASSTAKDKIDKATAPVKAKAEEAAEIAKSKANDAKIKAESAIGTAKSTAKKHIDSAVTEAKTKAKEAFDTAMKNPDIKKAYDILDKYSDKVATDVYNAVTGEKGQAVINAINTVAGTKLIDIKANASSQVIQKVEKKNEDSFNPDLNHAEGYGSDDRTKAITSKVEYYRENEPSFLKSFKKLALNDDGTWETTEEMVSAVNPSYSMTNTDGKNNVAATVNCFHCTTAYDLRKRGYDVSAAAAQSRFSDVSSLDKFYDIETKIDSNLGKATAEELSIQRFLEDESQNIYHLKKDYDAFGTIGSKERKKATEEGNVYAMWGVKDNKNNVNIVSPTKAIAEYCKNKGVDTNNTEALSEALKYGGSRTAIGNIMGDSLIKAAEAYPNNSWGRVNVYWNGGSGHSIAWEKDYDGTVRFLDAQSNKEIDIHKTAAAASLYTPMQLTRTDNLQVKDTVTWFANSTEEGVSNASAYKSLSKK